MSHNTQPATTTGTAISAGWNDGLFNAARPFSWVQIDQDVITLWVSLVPFRSTGRKWMKRTLRIDRSRSPYIPSFPPRSIFIWVEGRRPRAIRTGRHGVEQELTRLGVNVQHRRDPDSDPAPWIR